MLGPEAHDRIPESVPSRSVPPFEYTDIEKEERIGTGGDADVYRGIVSEGGETYPVAVKEPRFQGTIQASVVDRFSSEARTWAKLDDHENIVSVYAWGTEPLPWLALEYMDGGTLESRIGSLELDEALWLAGRVAEGVRYGHRHGVAHLDLKPTNVLLCQTSSDTWDYPKVSDWGLAKLLLEHSNSVEGISPTYAAPEQFDPEAYGSPDDITDIYQLGTLTYALLTGEPPFTGPSAAVMQSVLQETPRPPSAVAPDVPGAVDKVILRALAKEKEKRYDGVLLLRDELNRLFEEYADDAGDVSASTAVTGDDSSHRTAPATEASGTGGTVAGSDDESATTTEGRTQQSRSSDESSLLTRRLALGMMSAGVVGAGGFLALTGGGSEDSGEGSSPPAVTPTPTTTVISTPPETATPTARPQTENSDTQTEVPSNTGQVTLDDFEGSDLSAWEIIEGSSADVEYVSDSKEGERALYLAESNTPVTVRKELSSPAVIDEFSYWFKYRSLNDNNLQFWLQDSDGGNITQIREFGSELYYREPPDLKANNYITDIEQESWYRVHIHDVDFDNNRYDVRIHNSQNVAISEVNDIDFFHAASSLGAFRIRDYLGYDNVSAPVWVDNITYTV